MSKTILYWPKYRCAMCGKEYMTLPFEAPAAAELTEIPRTATSYMTRPCEVCKSAGMVGVAWLVGACPAER